MNNDRKSLPEVITASVQHTVKKKKLKHNAMLATQQQEQKKMWYNMTDIRSDINYCMQ